MYISEPAFFRESAFIANADAFVVPAGDMCSNLMCGTADMHLALAG